MKRISLLIILLFVLSCTRKDLAAEVGDYKILKSDVDKKNRIIRLYFPEETRDLGLQQLIDSYINASILDKYGKKINPEQLDAEENRIEKESQLPDLLKKIQGIFGDDKETYRRVFVLPVMADRMIYFDLFATDKSFQKESFQKAADILQQVQQTPEKMQTISEDSKLSLITFRLKKENGTYTIKNLNPEGKEEISPLAKEGSRWHHEIISTTPAQKVYKNVVDMTTSWMVIKNNGYIKDSKENYELQALVIPKDDFSRWLQRERETIKIKKY